MINLLGSSEIFKNVLALIAPYRDPQTENESVQRSWSNAYRKYLGSIQPAMPVPTERIHVESRSHSVEKFLSAFNEKSLLSDIEFSLQTSTEAEILEASVQFKKQLARIEKDFPILSQVAEFFLHTIFFASSNRASGGTTSGAIGVLWANPRSFWTEEDYLEFMAHELTHTLVFMDERRFKHYLDLDLALSPENYALSAVLNRRRPIDKVIHSIIVATEVLLFREARNGHSISRRLHPPSSILKSQTLESIRSLEPPNIQSLLAPRALELVKMCQQKLQKLHLKKNENLHA